MATMLFPSCDNVEATTRKRQRGSDNSEATTWKRQRGKQFSNGGRNLNMITRIQWYTFKESNINNLAIRTPPSTRPPPPPQPWDQPCRRSLMNCPELCNFNAVSFRCWYNGTVMYKYLFQKVRSNYLVLLLKAVNTKNNSGWNYRSTTVSRILCKIGVFLPNRLYTLRSVFISHQKDSEVSINS